MNLKQEFTNLYLWFNLTLPDNSKFQKGKHLEEDGENKIVLIFTDGIENLKENPRIDKFFVDKSKLGPMVLDALMFIKNQIDPH